MTTTCGINQMDKMLARCKSCRTGYSRPYWTKPADTVTECCGTALKYQRVLGLVNETKCDGRCMNAIGPICECECGGENHGNRWGA